MKVQIYFKTYEKMKDGKTASDVHSPLINWLIGRGISILPPPQYFSR